MNPGILWIIGLGPGPPGLLAPAAAAALDAAEVVVGYHGYLDLIVDRLAGKEVIGRELGQEVERAAIALDRAESGRTVALVSSGDAGVYGMGGVACELAARRASPAAIIIVPGVPAARAAAARLGAPLAQDWACISLSDLLTPWDLILRRVEAAARADFVLVFYNPASKTRTHQLPTVARLLLNERARGTPVGLVENAYRPGETVRVIRLEELAQARVSMFTTVIVGNSRTFIDRGRMITPRIESAPSPIPAPPSPIFEESMSLLDRELGPNPADPAERAIVRRMVHASADFDYAVNARFAPGAVPAAVAALRRGAPIVADVEMLRWGINRDRADRLGVGVVCAVSEPATAALAAAAGLTRSAAGLHRATERVGDGAIVAIGNAPTALLEALRLIEAGWQPSCVIGIPVGFVGVEEVKRRLIAQQRVPWITSLGRKGGTAVTAAVVNALLERAARGPGP
jgi:precorrin-3B C17-methyltransferase